MVCNCLSFWNHPVTKHNCSVHVFFPLKEPRWTLAGKEKTQLLWSRILSCLELNCRFGIWIRNHSYNHEHLFRKYQMYFLLLRLMFSAYTTTFCFDAESQWTFWKIFLNSKYIGIVPKMILPPLERWWDGQLQATFPCAWAKITTSRVLSGRKRPLAASWFQRH